MEVYPSTAQAVVQNWPTPILFSGFEIGVDIMTGLRLYQETPVDNPVRKAYELFIGYEGSRHSWDLTAVLCGVRGTDGYWDTQTEGTVVVDELGNNVWCPNTGGSHSYLVKKADDSFIENVLESLMVEALAQ